MKNLENGKYLFFAIGGFAYILKTDNEKKSKKLCKTILDKFMKENNLDCNNFTEKQVNDTIEKIMKESSFVELEKKTDYVSLKSRYFGGAYKYTDFKVC